MGHEINALWGNVFTNILGKETKGAEFLKKIPMFRDMNTRELSVIERILHLREYEANEPIFLEGTPGLGMYIIEAGVVDIVADSGHHRLSELGEGEFFGELSLLDDSPRTASAIAKTPCKLLCFFQPDLFDLIERTPRLGVKILFNLSRVLGERLKKSNELLREEKLKGK